jgi:hypothetical protein
MEGSLDGINPGVDGTCHFETVIPQMSSERTKRFDNPCDSGSAREIRAILN